MTRGKAIGIFLALLIFSLAAGIALVAPLFLFFGDFGETPKAASPGAAAMLGMFAYIFLGFALFTIASAAIGAAIHAVIGDSAERDIEGVFA